MIFKNILENLFTPRTATEIRPRIEHPGLLRLPIGTAIISTSDLVREHCAYCQTIKCLDDKSRCVNCGAPKI
jgi:hypothetical protein